MEDKNSFYRGKREREREGQRRVERSTNKEQGLDVISDDEGGRGEKRKRKKSEGRAVKSKEG